MPGARPPHERQRPGGWKACQQHTRRNKANIDAFWLRPVKSIVILSSALLGATRKRKALRKVTEPGSQIGSGAPVRMQIEDPVPRRSRATKVHAGNLESQARRSRWQRALPGPVLGHGSIVCRYPPPSLKLHLHHLTPKRIGREADRRSGQPLEHKISRSHATAEYS